MSSMSSKNPTMSRILPVAVPPTSHGLKYRLFYGRKNDRVVGYVNERGKATTGNGFCRFQPVGGGQ